MMDYLNGSISMVREIIEKEGVSALYESVDVNGEQLPRYMGELLLNHWELKSILAHLGIDPINPGKVINK